MERDYSVYIKNPSPLRDDRPFLIRLLSSLRLSFFLDSKKDSSTNKTKKGVGIQVKGGVEF